MFELEVVQVGVVYGVDGEEGVLVEEGVVFVDGFASLVVGELASDVLLALFDDVVHAVGEFAVLVSHDADSSQVESTQRCFAWVGFIIEPLLQYLLVFWLLDRDDSV